MEKSAVGWMVMDGARLKVSKLCQKKKGEIFRVKWRKVCTILDRRRDLSRRRTRAGLKSS